MATQSFAAGGGRPSV